MFRTSFGCIPELRGDNPLVWPGEDVSESWRGTGIIILARDVEREVKEYLSV
jgi:hypothetical protein